VSARAKTSFCVVDTAFDGYDWGSPTPPKHISRTDRTLSPEQTLWLSVLNTAWVDALTVPKELVCGQEAKANVKQIERYLIAAEEVCFMNWLYYGKRKAETDPNCQHYLHANGMPTKGVIRKARERKRRLRPPFTRDQIELLRAWLWITEQHPSFKTACHLSGCDAEGVSDGIYRAVTGRGRARPKLVHAAPLDD